MTQNISIVWPGEARGAQTNFGYTLVPRSVLPGCGGTEVQTYTDIGIISCATLKLTTDISAMSGGELRLCCTAQFDGKLKGSAGTVAKLRSATATRIVILQ